MDKGIESLATALGARVTESKQSIEIENVIPDEYSNAQMEQMLIALEPLLDRRDIVGYAAARNTRVLRAEALEYLKPVSYTHLDVYKRQVSVKRQRTA